MEFVVSDISRPGFVSPSGDLRKLQDCGTWRVRSVDRKLEQVKARKQVSQIMSLVIISPKLLDETLKKASRFGSFAALEAYAIQTPRSPSTNTNSF